MVELRLTCVSASAHAKMGTQVKRLPRSTNLGALRSLCEKLFKVKLGAMALYVKAPGDPVPEEMGDDDSTALSYWAVQVRAWACVRAWARGPAPRKGHARL